MVNEETTWNVTRNREDNLKPFSSEYQPTPEQIIKRSKTRERKKEAQKLMDYFMEMSEKSIEEVKNHVKEQGDNMIIRQALICKYIVEWFKDKKIMQDIINRHVSYAPIKQEHTGDEWADLFQNVTFNVVQRPVTNNENQQ